MDIIGRWEVTGLFQANGIHHKYEFLNDGTFRYHNVNNGRRVEGTYSLSGDLLTMVNNGGNQDRYRIEKRDNFLSLYAIGSPHSVDYNRV